MNTQRKVADVATDTVEQMRELINDQMAALKTEPVSRSLNQMAGRMEERFGVSKEDAMQSMQQLFDKYGDDVLDLVARKTNLPVQRKKAKRNRKIATFLTIAIGALAIARWFYSQSGDES